MFDREFGPADDVEIQNGYRVWHWERADVEIYLRGYSNGVQITQRARRSTDESSAPVSSDPASASDSASTLGRPPVGLADR